jgi:Spy/CpxP family protein refolding chaperone
MKKLLSFLLLLAMAGLTTSATAQQNQGYGLGERMFPMLNRVLTDEQRQSLQQIIAPQRDQLRPLEEKLRSSRQALVDQITSGNFNEALASQDANESAQAEADLTMVFAKALAKMQPPLSAEQISQIKNFQPGRFEGNRKAADDAPENHLKLPPPLPRDTNDLPVVN